MMFVLSFLKVLPLIPQGCSYKSLDETEQLLLLSHTLNKMQESHMNPASSTFLSQKMGIPHTHLYSSTVTAKWQTENWDGYLARTHTTFPGAQVCVVLLFKKIPWLKTMQIPLFPSPMSVQDKLGKNGKNLTAASSSKNEQCLLLLFYLKVCLKDQLSIVQSSQQNSNSRILISLIVLYFRSIAGCQK